MACFLIKLRHIAWSDKRDHTKDAAPLIFIYIDREDIMDFIAVQGAIMGKWDQNSSILGWEYANSILIKVIRDSTLNSFFFLKPKTLF